MERQFFVTYTIRKNWDFGITRQFGYKHAFCQNAVSTKKTTCLYILFSQKHNMPKCWCAEDRPRFLLYAVKLCVGGLRQIAFSRAMC